MTVSGETLRSISTPERVDSRLESLEFVDGVPSPQTVEMVYDRLDYVHALNVFLNGFAGASTYALHKGFQEAGANDNEILMFSELMGSESLFLTANADTVYFIGIVDLSSGPMVIETPPQALGIFDDMWWRWIVDFGLPGPDRGEGGRFLLVGPGDDGPLPDSGYHVGHSRTTRAFLLGRAFMVDDDPAPTVELIKRTTKIYPYGKGGFGTSTATLLEGEVRPDPQAQIPETVFVEASGKAFNTIPPTDIGFYELLNELVQEQPAGSTDIELMGELAAIGIVKGKPFEPDDRMRRILEEAAAVGSATSRALLFDPRASDGFAYYDGSAWETTTIYPNDFSYWELVHELVQQEPPGASDPDLLGLLASVGIVHGKPFEPDERMRKILEDAVAVGNATARTVTFAPRPEEGFAFYPNSEWCSALFLGGYRFLDPPAEITADGPVAVPSNGARKLGSRTNFFYMATGITPAMCMCLTGIGSQYIYAMRDSERDYLDGGRNYRLTLPADIPESRFWSVMLYDRQTRSMLQTDQPHPSLGSQSGTVEANPDGTTDIYFGPTAPDGKTSNWIQTVPGKGWWTVLRLYNPLQGFFDKSWRPSEIEPVD